METIYYKCEVCGFVYQLPSYWTGHAPEETIELEHLNLQTKDMCHETKLILMND